MPTRWRANAGGTCTFLIAVGGSAIVGCMSRRCLVASRRGPPRSIQSSPLGTPGVVPGRAEEEGGLPGCDRDFTFVHPPPPHGGTCSTIGTAELGPTPAAASTSVVQLVGSSTTGGTGIRSAGCQLAVADTGLCRARRRRGVG
jgi:hypothetical protein